MKTKYILSLLMCCFIFIMRAQINPIKLKTAENIKEKLEEFDSIYKKIETKLKDVKFDIKEIKKLTSQEDLELETYIDELKTQTNQYDLIVKLNKINDSAQLYKKFYAYEIKDDALGIGQNLDKYFEPRDKIKTDLDNNQQSEPKTYLYFGEDKVIAENDSFFNNKEFNTVFKDLLSEQSEAYLGDFIIPQNGQKVHLYKPKQTSKNEYYRKKEISQVEVFFKSVKIHVLHGLLQDIKIIVLDSQGNELLFENRIPVSLLKYSKLAPRNYMFYRHTISNNKDRVVDTSYINHSIKLADVLMYINNPGDNYVPDELRLSFPTKTDGNIDNDISSVKYKVKQNTTLENVLNIKTYTDFLSLFGDSPNGIFQFEGKADFYLIPFNFPNTNMFNFKKISPYVNFARLDDETRNINVENNSITNELEILEKAYLNIGVDLDVLSFKLGKEYPFETTFYGKAQYNIADLRDVDSTSVNYKSLSLGGGFRFDVKRFNNFGFTIKSEWTNTDTREFNNYSFIENPGDFVVFRNEAEIHYHPAGQESQAVFLRLSTFNNHTENNSEAFYQFQFGYRFSIGINKLKTNP